VSRQQIDSCASRIRDPAAKDRFLRMMARADQLITEAAKLRTMAWADFRRATGEVKRIKSSGPYA
jgi:hypothetical protein